jgi:SAM-dependent methyltransferase
MNGPVCRLCQQPLGRVFVDLGMSPLSNAFLRATDLQRMEPFFPLRVYVCDQCLLVQLPPTEKAEAIFREDYIYFSAYSQSWLAHSERYAKQMISRLGLTPKSLVMEVASNDGYLLQYFAREGIPVLGIEPSASVASVAQRERNIPTEVCFFGVETARRLAQAGKQADLIAGNNVFAHVPDVHDFVGGFPLVLAPHGVLTLEFPHLARLIESNQFDTIYQEHYSYFSFGTAVKALEAHGLSVFDVDELPTHGGSLRVYAQHRQSGRHPVSERVSALHAAERRAGLDRLEGHLGFRDKVDGVKRDLLAFLIEAKRQGKRVVGYGAPAKGNTLLNYCGVREDFLDFTVDRSPHKQGTFLPGVHIPVLAPERLDAAKPDYVLVLPWNLREELTQQLAHVRQWGGKLVFAVPKLEVVS